MRRGNSVTRRYRGPSHRSGLGAIAKDDAGPKKPQKKSELLPSVTQLGRVVSRHCVAAEKDRLNSIDNRGVGDDSVNLVNPSVSFAAQATNY